MFRSMIPWRERLPLSMAQIENEMEDLMERYLGASDEWRLNRFTPAVNVAETDGQYEISADLPGMKPEDVTVELKNGSLWIRGEKKEEVEEKEKTFHRIERRHGAFARMIKLPGAVAQDQVDAQFEDGVLKVRVPKTEETKPVRIEIKSQ
ncbi:MAG: Hsp20/alpha crystallin family protein [Planctomycetales bacterium]|nr:Hsp20/alpha crystallin family protein [Planctomycetales bacterium]